MYSYSIYWCVYYISLICLLPISYSISFNLHCSHDNAYWTEDKGYEPPQGKIYIETDLSGIVKCDEKGIGGRYTLSEDKDDRKDGLWIWGLFEEPKYPFLYMNMDVYNSTVLPSGEEEPIFGGTGLPNGRLYIRFSHQLVKEIGVVLTAPQMNYKETEIVKADILGIVQFDAGEYKPAGSIEVFPLLNNPASSGGEASDNRTAANATPLQLQVRDFNPSKDSAL